MNNQLQFTPSIFNDVLAPITLGPSSSNTCGPFRIGLLAVQLLGEDPISLEVEMSQTGGFADSFYGMQSDKGFITGVLKKDFLHYDLEQAYDDAKANELAVSFTFTDNPHIPQTPTESALVTLSGKTRTLTLLTASLGGGDINITSINDVPVYIDGRSAVTVELDGHTMSCEPIYDVIPHAEAKPLFTRCDQMIDFAIENAMPLWQVALAYEASLSDLTEEDVWNLAEKTYALAMESIEKGFSPDNHFSGVTTAKAPSIKGAFDQNRYIPLGAASVGIPYALSIMEYSNAHGKIVCMPTGGSSGIIPASIEAMTQSMDLSHDTKIQALLVAGLLGVFYYPTHYTGALGCQAEIGVAISMAAGAMASLMTDDPKTVEKAAVLGIQSVLGMLCDPIEGYVQVPCFIRNMTAVPTAMTCANSALAGLDALVNLDDMVQVVITTGEKLHPINNFGTCSCYHRK